jgi:hypothetical protein
MAIASIAADLFPVKQITSTFAVRQNERAIGLQPTAPQKSCQNQVNTET